MLTDVAMPRLEGFGPQLALCPNPAGTILLGVLLPARTGEELRLDGLDAGAGDSLIKPFSAREATGRRPTVLNRTGGFPIRESKGFSCAEQIPLEVGVDDNFELIVQRGWGSEVRHLC